MIRKSLIILFLVSLMVSCKSTKSTSSRIPGISSEKLADTYYDHSFKGKTLRAQLNIKYKGKEDLPVINANLRMIRDSVIWISFSKLGFPIGKLMIFPNRVQFYEKINKTYFDGDYSLISDKIGTAMDFYKVQNLFLGQPLLDLNSQKFKLMTDQGAYLIQPKNNEALYKIMFWIDPVNFNMTQENISYKKANKNLTIQYNYGGEILNLPQSFSIFAEGKKGKTKIDIKYRKISLPSRLSFPFKIPDNYKEIELK